MLGKFTRDCNSFVNLIGSLSSQLCISVCCIPMPLTVLKLYNIMVVLKKVVDNRDLKTISVIATAPKINYAQSL